MSAIAKPRIRELASRHNAGIHVYMEWDSQDDEIRIVVESPTANFTLFPPNHKAIDVYHHPFAYMDSVLMCGQFRRES